MKEKLTTQDVINMASNLFDNKGYTRADVRIFMNALVSYGMWNVSQDTLERVFDLVVG